MDRCLRPLTGVLLAVSFSAVQAQFAAQAPEVIPHGSSTRLPATSNVVTVSGDAGTRAGSNLLHSFSVFNIFSGGTVTYTSPTAPGPAVGHVVTRVTGGTSEITGGKFSLIQGTLTGIAGASFWFINPNGIIFGSGAVLNGASAFHFSTADYIKLADGVSISANPEQGAALTVAPPAAFGFLTANPAAITVGNTTGSILRPRLSTGATNPEGTLSLVGGTIDIGPPDGTPGFAPGAKGPGFIHAHSRLNLVSVASAGEATFDGRGFNVDAFPQLGAINIKQGGVVDSREVFIRAGRLTLDNGAIVPWVFRSLLPAGTVLDGGEVNVNVSNEMIVRGQLVNGALPNLGFPAGIYTFSVPVASEASMNEATASRAVPDINIQAGSVSVDGGGGTIGAANIRSERFAPGAAADVVIDTGSLEVRNGGFIAVNNFFGTTPPPPGSAASPAPPAGGTLTVNAEHVELSGEGTPAFTGIAGQSNFNNFYSPAASQPDIRRDPRLTNADGATVTINVTGPGSLVVRGGAEISTDSFGLGRAGDIDIQATDIFLSRDGAATGLIASQSLFAGPSGDVKINAAGRIVMSGGFQISATTGGTGDGGIVTVAAGQSISMDGTNTGIFSTTVRPPESRLNTFANRMGASTFAALRTGLGLPANADIPQVLEALNSFIPAGRAAPLTRVSDLTIGDAGKLTVTTPLMSMKNGARIDNSTAWDGSAGEIFVNIGSLDLNSGAQIRSQSGLVRLSTGILEVGSGDAGKVTITASDSNSVTISGVNSGISTTTFGAGQGGAIEITGAGEVVIRDRGTVSSSTEGVGAAGEVKVSTPRLTMGDGARISVSTSGAGNAGTIGAEVGALNLTGGARIESNTIAAGAGGGITVEASNVSIFGDDTGLFTTASSTGNAGQIAVSTSTLMLGERGRIDSSTLGAGNGGAINLTAAAEVGILSGGSLRADSLGSGNTGSITIAAGDRIVMDNGSISTRAVTSDGGNITLMAPNIIRLNNSQITTSVESGTGGGGNIFIDPQFVILNGSSITANAFGGPGGNITIVANNFLADPTSVVQASSALSTPGTVQIQSPDNNVASDIAQLPRELVDASRLLRGGCSARRTGAPSSFMVAGRGGVPVDPDGYLPAFSASAGPFAGARGAEAGQGFALAMAGLDCWR